jgi:hypothetical protein
MPLRSPAASSDTVNVVERGSDADLRPSFRLGCRARFLDLRAGRAFGFVRMEHDLSAVAVALGLDAALPPVMELKGKVAELAGREA